MRLDTELETFIPTQRCGIDVSAFRTTGNAGAYETGGISNALTTNRDPCSQVICEKAAIRRLTPTECERLQGFPDGWSAITYRGKPATDGPRYKALGNSMAVNVIRWIGRRIECVEQILQGKDIT